MACLLKAQKVFVQMIADMLTKADFHMTALPDSLPLITLMFVNVSFIESAPQGMGAEQSNSDFLRFENTNLLIYSF